jgi:hypothetical protein
VEEYGGSIVHATLRWRSRGKNERCRKIVVSFDTLGSLGLTLGFASL